ncbi:MAG: heme NO-binding domain-containing protein [Saprospiraceae bacterium]|nr:heme NO-binding domain-containing protein [Saprospiraceae bacterium]
MYGIVNKAVKGMVLENFGEATWEKIKQKSGVDIDVFLSNQPYDDALTYKLAIGASEVLEIPLSKVLSTLGEYWILRTGMENYGSLLESGGNSFREFLINLPNFHSRVMLMFPDLEPPEFKISNIQEKSLYVHYYSHRAGLADFVYGLFHGLAKMHKTEIEVELLESRDNGHDHEVFEVKW